MKINLNRKNQVFLKPNEQKQLKWKFSHLTLLVWIICEYSFIHHMDVEIFVIIAEID